jgi:hypothetical protein
MNISRRAFLLVGPAAVAGYASWTKLDFRHGPVLSFHLDHPYIDHTGLYEAYLPPSGMRSGAPIAVLTDADLCRYYGQI